MMMQSIGNFRFSLTLKKFAKTHHFSNTCLSSTRAHALASKRRSPDKNTTNSSFYSYHSVVVIGALCLKLSANCGAYVCNCRRTGIEIFSHPSRPLRPIILLLYCIILCTTYYCIIYSDVSSCHIFLLRRINLITYYHTNDRSTRRSSTCIIQLYTSSK